VCRSAGLATHVRLKRNRPDKLEKLSGSERSLSNELRGRAATVIYWGACRHLVFLAPGLRRGFARSWANPGSSSGRIFFAAAPRLGYREPV
jgi:hypothetical protein